MITEVDDEERTRDLPSLEAKIEAEKKQLANKRDEEINKRQLKLEEDTAALEAEGAKADARRKVREAAEREMNGIRRRADAQIAALDEVFDRFPQPQGPGPRGQRNPLPRDARPLRPLLQGWNGRCTRID